MKDVPISEACDVNPPKPKLASLADDTAVLFIPMAAVDEVSGTVSDPQTRNLGELRQKSYRSLQPGDVIFAKITPCMENGKSAVVPDFPSGVGFGSTEFHVLRPRLGVDARYVWHFVRQDGFRRQARDAMTGTVGQERVPAAFVGQALIPLPSEEVQRQTAELLDSAVGSARSANSHLATATRAIERFRRSIFAAACSGLLTAEWRSRDRHVQSAEELVAAIAEGRRTRSARRVITGESPTPDDALPESWVWTTVGALVDVATGATPLRGRSEYYDGNIPWVTSGAVNSGLVTHAKEYISELAIRDTNAKVFPPGTLLIAMYGEGQTRGRVGELGIAAATNQAVAALLFDTTNEGLRPYLRLFSLRNYERIRQLSFGGVQPNLSLGVIRDTVVPLPPYDEQLEIIARVDELTTLADRLMTSINSASHQIERSAQAVLAKAFRGDLAVSVR